MSALSGIAASLAAARGSRVLIVGDLMLDHYLFGEVERISPEAPVPVVRVEREMHLLGGAGNVAKNIAALGGAPILLSMAGDDDAGRILGALLASDGITGGLIADTKRPTTIKTRIIARNQQVVRVDRESHDEAGPDRVDLLIRAINEHIDQADVVLVSDYGKGVVGKRVMDAVRAAAASSAKRPPVIVDPKTYQYDLYHGVDLLTPNRKEAAECAGMRLSGKSEIVRAGHAIFKKLRPRHLLVTLGSDGIALFTSPGKIERIPTVARNVYDVTGAGDTVIAALAMGMSAGLSLLDSCIAANYAAGVVVGKVGAASVGIEELARELATAGRPVIETWLDED